MSLKSLNLGEVFVDGDILNLDILSVEELLKYREKLIKKRDEIHEAIKNEIIETK